MQQYLWPSGSGFGAADMWSLCSFLGFYQRTVVESLPSIAHTLVYGFTKHKGKAISVFWSRFHCRSQDLILQAQTCRLHCVSTLIIAFRKLTGSVSEGVKCPLCVWPNKKTRWNVFYVHLWGLHCMQIITIFLFIAFKVFSKELWRRLSLLLWKRNNATCAWIQ